MRQVLLIDDNPLQLTVREAILRDAGFQVSVATTADSALATLRGLPDRIGVVVTDHIMPGCTGSELVQQIRSAQYWLPVVVLERIAGSRKRISGLECGLPLQTLSSLGADRVSSSSLEHVRTAARAPPKLSRANPTLCD